MIKDKIINIERYSINEMFEVFKQKISDYKKGYPTQLDQPMKAIDLEYQTKKLDFSKFENHTKYIDIHLMIKGKELFAITDSDSLVAINNYDNQNDYQFFQGVVKDKVSLETGEFLILFPGEAHMAGGEINAIEKVKKMVYKIPNC